MKPVIGITPSFDHENHRYQLNNDYMQAVLRAGAVPLILPLTEDPQVLDEAFSHLDGLLLTGGADPDPSLYGEETMPVCGKTDADYPDLQFRYCSRCQGYHCFCEEHISNHIQFTE